jgi:hypothetical protein
MAMIELNKASTELRALLEQGIKSHEELSIKTGIDIGVVRRIAHDFAKEQKVNRSHEEILQGHLAMINELIEIAEGEYQADPMDRKAFAVTGLVQTAQGIIQELKAAKDPVAISEDLAKKAIEPLIRAIFKQITSDLAKLRDQLEKEVTSEYHSIIDTHIKDLIRDLGPVASDLFKQAKADLLTTLTGKLETKRVKLTSI